MINNHKTIRFFKTFMPIIGVHVLRFTMFFNATITGFELFLARSYLDKKDRKTFDQMYDYVKLNNAACSNACRPVVVHAVLMSIIFEHYKQLTKLTEQQKGKP